MCHPLQKTCGQIPNFLCARQRRKRASTQQQTSSSDLHEWIENQPDPKTWACSYSLQAIAERTGMPIVVFKKQEDSDQWIRTLFASKFSRGKACAARQEHVLEKHHYTYLTPPSEGKIPPTWLAGESNPDCAVIDFTGDGESTGTASVHTMLSDNLSRTNKASRSIAAALATATNQHSISYLISQ